MTDLVGSRAGRPAGTRSSSRFWRPHYTRPPIPQFGPRPDTICALLRAELRRRPLPPFRAIESPHSPSLSRFCSGGFMHARYSVPCPCQCRPVGCRRDGAKTEPVCRAIARGGARAGGPRQSTGRCQASRAKEACTSGGSKETRAASRPSPIIAARSADLASTAFGRRDAAQTASATCRRAIPPGAAENSAGPGESAVAAATPE